MAQTVRSMALRNAPPSASAFEVERLDRPAIGKEARRRRIIELGVPRLVDLDALMVVDLDEDRNSSSCSGATSSSYTRVSDTDAVDAQQRRSELIRDLQQHVKPTRKLKRTASADILLAKEDALKQLFFQISELERKVQDANAQSSIQRRVSSPSVITKGHSPDADNTGQVDAVPQERSKTEASQTSQIGSSTEKKEFLLQRLQNGMQHELERLVGILNCVAKTPSKKEDAARKLCALACEEANQSYMVFLGVIPPLVDLMRSCKQSAQEEAARTLRRLAYQNGMHKESIVAAGAIPPLTFLLAPERALCLRDQACALLGSLSVDCPNHKTAIGEAGAIPWIVELLGCGHPLVMEQAARTLWHLSVNHPENKALIARAHAIPPLVHLLQHGSGDLSEQARGALTSLTMGNITNKAAVRRAAAVAGCDLEDAGLKQHAEHVLLHVYDVGGDGSVRYVNELLRNVGAGAFHAGVEVYGEEWSFGHRETQQITGVFCYKPRQSSTHTYRETVEMGFTSLSHIEVLSIIARLAACWPGEEYDFITKNCCHFCSALCVELGTSPAPEWVTNLAGAGATLINGYRAVVAHAHAAASTVASTSNRDDTTSDRGILKLAAQGVGVVANTLEQIAGDGFSNGFVQAISKTNDRLESALVRNGLMSEGTGNGLDVTTIALQCVFAQTCDIAELPCDQKTILLPAELGSWSIGLRHQPVLFYNLVPDDVLRRKYLLDTHFLLSWDPPDLYITKINTRATLVNGTAVPMPPDKMKLPPRARIGLCEAAGTLEVGDATSCSNSSSPFLIFEVQLRDFASSANKDAQMTPSSQLPSQATRQPQPLDEGSAAPAWLESHDTCSKNGRGASEVVKESQSQMAWI